MNTHASRAESPVKFSLLLPTRGRPERVGRLFRSIVETARDPDGVEVVLAVDEDDEASQALTHERLRVKTVVVPKGLTMGALNTACFEASSGRYVMLVNDDVVARTRGWDAAAAAAFARFEDDVALVHVNDLLFGELLCTFPMLSRRACEEVGGICPTYYQRYGIDDHIFDTYNILAYLGHARVVYLPDVVFEHENYEQLGPGHDEAKDKLFVTADRRVYVPKRGPMREDSRRFYATLEERKRDALRLASFIDARRCGEEQARRKRDEYRRLLSYVVAPKPYPGLTEFVAAAGAGPLGGRLLPLYVRLKKFDDWVCRGKFGGLGALAAWAYRDAARRAAVGGYRRLRGVRRQVL